MLGFKFRVARVVSPFNDNGPVRPESAGPSGPGPRSPGRGATPPPGWNAGTLD